MGGKDASAKVVYLLMLLVSVIACLLLRLYGADLVVHIFSFQVGCTGTTDVTQRCLGIQAVYRVSFGAAAFFLLMSLITACVPSFHRGLWFVKILIYIAAAALSFLIPNDAMVIYGTIARIVSGLFLLIQIVILVDFAYDWSEYWISMAEETDGGNLHEAGMCSNKYKVWYLVAGFGMLLASIVGVILLYALYPLTCPLNIATITISWVTGLGYTIMALSNKVNKGLLAPAIVFLYCIFLNWGGISANPDPVCNPSQESLADSIIGFIIAALSLVYTLFTTTNSVFLLFYGNGSGSSASTTKTGEKGDVEMENRKKKALDHVLTTDNVKMDKERDIEAAGEVVGKGKSTAATNKDGDEPEEIETALWFFHLIMAIGGIYMAMLLSNWGEISNNTTTSNRSTTGMWVKIASEWVTIALFFWTLSAPFIFPNRDFTDSRNQFH